MVGVVDFGWVWLGLFGWFRRGQLGVGVVGDGLGSVALGFGGFAEVVDAVAVFAHGGDDFALVEGDQLDELGGREFDQGHAVVEAVDGVEGVLVVEAFELIAEAAVVFDEAVVGEGLGELGPVGFEQFEVLVDGGVGDVEFGGDFAKGPAAFAQAVGVEDAPAASGRDRHGVSFALWWN